MKTVFALLLTALTFMFVSKIFAQTHHPIVQLIYLIPTDRTPKDDIEKKMRTIVKEVQQFYADEMERHGFGRKTFQFETDATGAVKIHRVKGKLAATEYQHGADDFSEFYEHFDRRNIFFIVIDEKDRPKDEYEFSCASAGQHWKNLDSGSTIRMFTTCLRWRTAAHEFGHAFGLGHDWRKDNYVLGYGSQDELSKCAAEWLNVHHAFNVSQNVNAPPIVEMLPPSLVSSPSTIRFRFKVRDIDGVHQAQLIGKTGWSLGSGLIACKTLDGKPSSTIEFVTTLWETADYIELQTMDVHGNFDDQNKTHIFPIDINSLPLAADVNGDGVVNVLDLVIVANSIGKSDHDLNEDGAVNVLDLIVVSQAISSGSHDHDAGESLPIKLLSVEPPEGSRITPDTTITITLERSPISASANVEGVYRVVENKIIIAGRFPPGTLNFKIYWGGRWGSDMKTLTFNVVEPKITPN